MPDKNRLETLQHEIIELKKKTALNIMDIGDRLIEAKSLVNFGEWEKWLDTNVNISKRTARYFMKAAQTFPADVRQSLADLDITKIYLLTDLNDEDRQSLLNNDILKTATTRELKQLVRVRHVEDYAVFSDGELTAIGELIAKSDNLELVKGYYDFLLEMGQAISEMVLDLEVKIAVQA